MQLLPNPLKEAVADPWLSKHLHPDRIQGHSTFQFAVHPTAVHLQFTSTVFGQVHNKLLHSMFDK